MFGEVYLKTVDASAGEEQGRTEQNKKETRTRLRGLKAGASMPVFESFPQLDAWLLTSLGS